MLGKTQVASHLAEAGSNSDTVGLSGGGWATSVTDTDGFSDITYYDATGTAIDTNEGLHAAGGRLAQLTNGNVIAVGSPSAGGVNFSIQSATGSSVTFSVCDQPGRSAYPATQSKGEGRSSTL